jgi:hypothetical protein
MKVDHLRRDAFYLLKSAVTCIQSADCTQDDVDMALRNIGKATTKLEEYESVTWPEDGIHG